jgi:hypothetical protein
MPWLCNLLRSESWRRPLCLRRRHALSCKRSRSRLREAKDMLATRQDMLILRHEMAELRTQLRE